MFLIFAYVLMNRYQGFPYFKVLKNEPKYKKKSFFSLKISLLNGIGRKFRARVFAPGFHFFLNTGSLPIPQVWRNKTHIIFRRRKILKWKLIFNQCNQISNRNTASFLLYKFQLSFNHNRLYFLSCCCSDSSLLTPKL